MANSENCQKLTFCRWNTTWQDRMLSCCVNSLTNDWKMLVKQNRITFLEKGKDKGDVDKTIKNLSVRGRAKARSLEQTNYL